MNIKIDCITDFTMQSYSCIIDFTIDRKKTDNTRFCN